MSVVSRSHFELVRARRGLEKAFESGDWDALKDWDYQLGENLNRAFADDSRDSFELVEEMERVLQTYARLISNLPDTAVGCLTSFPRTIS